MKNNKEIGFSWITAVSAICLMIAVSSQSGAAAIAPTPVPVVTFAINLVTICTSAHTTTQASKCTAWQYNYYTPTAYIESYPQVSPGPAVWTDPAYEYRLGSTITPTMGVKVCPLALRPGTNFNSPAADPCPQNKLVSASTVIPQPPPAPTFSLIPGNYGPREISNVGLSGQTSVTISDLAPGATIHYTTDGSLPSALSPTYSVPILLPAGTVTTIQAIAFSRVNNIPSAESTATYTVPHFPSDDFAEPIQDLMTLCISATGITQAAQCKQWQYNFYSPGAFFESYPQVNPGPTGFTDPAYEYRMGSTITPAMGVKVCPSALLPGVSFSSTNADVCPNNALIAASTVVPTAPTRPSSTFLYNNESEQDSCAYYQTVGLVSGPCDLNPDGSFKNGITMSAWESKYYVPLVAQQNMNDCSTAGVDCFGRATFVNINDLNFVRAHTAVMRADGGAGVAFVCNYRGPDFYQDKLAENEPGPFVLNPVNQAAVDAAVQGAVGNLNPLPCVAFDYGAADAPALARSGPYIRMLVFNPAGNLASAVDLDGRGPKSIPNACSACHGVPFGQHLPSAPPTAYQLRQGASYIPFDMQNLEFSSATSPTDLTQAGQEAQIKILNKIVLSSAMALEPVSVSTQSVAALIHGWYDDYDNVSGEDRTLVTGLLTHATQQLWTPPDILRPSLNILPGTLGTQAISAGETSAQVLAASDEVGAYIGIYGPYCRSCHVANHVDQWTPPTEPGVLGNLLQTGGVCGANAFPVMPNSKMAFDRLWTSHIGPTATTDLDVTAILQAYMSDQNRPCVLHQFSNPIN